MGAWLAALQPVLVGGMLLWSGRFKLAGRAAARAAARSALPALVGPRWARPALRAVGLAELAAAGTVLLPPGRPLPAVLLCLGFLGYLGYARLAAPQSSCGCTSASRSPIGWRNFASAGALLAAGLAALAGDADWVAAGLARPGPAVAVLAGEALLMLALLPQFDRVWLTPLRRWKVRLTHPLAGATSTEVPLQATVQTLQRSEAYRALGRLLRSDVVDSWDEGEWRIVRYTLRYRQRPASAVFAVPRTGDAPERVRVAVVDEEDESVLFALAPAG
jgi:hypothetical protein